MTKYYSGGNPTTATEEAALQDAKEFSITVERTRTFKVREVTHYGVFESYSNTSPLSMGFSIIPVAVCESRGDAERVAKALAEQVK